MYMEGLASFLFDNSMENLATLQRGLGNMVLQDLIVTAVNDTYLFEPSVHS